MRYWLIYKNYLLRETDRRIIDLKYLKKIKKNLKKKFKIKKC